LPTRFSHFCSPGCSGSGSPIHCAAPRFCVDLIKVARSYFGNFDPFGDFDMIFGASKLGLKVIEVPIRYASRSYGQTQISRFRHGMLLLRMLWTGFVRIKAL